MPVTSFSPLLGLALPTTGDLAGTWGTTVNDSITSLLDTAVAGTTTLSTDADVTLSTTNGAANQARSSVLLCSGARTALRTITAPAQSKAYIIINQTTGGFAVKIVGSGPTTGVTIANGEKALVAWNGSDFVLVSAIPIDLTTDVTGTLPTTNGGTGLSSFTANRVFYSSSTSAIGSSANLTFDGTTLTANDIIDSSLTASKPVFTNGSKNLVSTGTVPTDQGGTGLTGFTAGNNAIYSTSSSALTAGTLPVLAGGTGSTTTSGARTNLGATTVGGNMFTLTNPSAVTFPRFNADNTVSALDAATFRSAIGAGTGGGSVTSVGGTGTVNGITLTGTVTSSGNLTLGGTLSGVSLTTQVSGILPIANGGTNSSATATAGGVGYGTGTAHAYTAAGSAGQVLTSNGTSAPTWQAASGGTTMLFSPFSYPLL